MGTVVGWGTGIANFVTNAVDTVYALPDIYNGLSKYNYNPNRNRCNPSKDPLLNPQFYDEAKLIQQRF